MQNIILALKTLKIVFFCDKGGPILGEGGSALLGIFPTLSHFSVKASLVLFFNCSCFCSFPLASRQPSNFYEKHECYSEGSLWSEKISISGNLANNINFGEQVFWIDKKSYSSDNADFWGLEKWSSWDGKICWLLQSKLLLYCSFVSCVNTDLIKRHQMNAGKVGKNEHRAKAHISGGIKFVNLTPNIPSQTPSVPLQDTPNICTITNSRCTISDIKYSTAITTYTFEKVLIFVERILSQNFTFFGIKFPGLQI